MDGPLGLVFWTFLFWSFKVISLICSLDLFGHMCLVGPPNPYKLEQSWELTFLIGLTLLNTKLASKFFFHDICLLLWSVLNWFLFDVRFMSYLKCSNWRQILKLALNFGYLFTFYYPAWANSLKTKSQTCNLQTGQSISYKYVNNFDWIFPIQIANSK